MFRSCRMCFTIASLFLGLLAATTTFAQQNPFLGSVPTGNRSSTPLALSLRDAIDRGLKANLGLLVSDSANEIAQGERVRALSALLPQVVGRVSENVQQL